MDIKIELDIGVFEFKIDFYKKYNSYIYQFKSRISIYSNEYGVFYGFICTVIRNDNNNIIKRFHDLI